MLQGFVFLAWMLARPPFGPKQAPLPRETRATFEITKRLVRAQTTPDMVKLCDAGDDIRGCTRFVGESLEPEYSSGPAGEWRVKLKGRMLALIIVKDPEVIGHEMQHIADMRASIRRLLLGWEERSYPSREACVSAAHAMIGDFRHELATIAAQSNAKLR